MTQLTIGKAQRAVYCTYCNKMKYKPQTTNHAHDWEAGEYYSSRFPDSHKRGKSDQVTSSSMLSQESSGLQAENRVDFFFPPLEPGEILGCFLPLMWNYECLAPRQFGEKTAERKLSCMVFL